MFSGLIFLISGCGKKGVGNDLIDNQGKSNFKIEGDNFVPDNLNFVTIPIVFSDLKGFDYMLVQKSGADVFSEKIPINQLSLQYDYKYKIGNEDPGSFSLVFNLVFKDGSRSTILMAKVINKHGFFIKSLKRIARVTGNSLVSEGLLNPNNTGAVWDVGGTDLGIVWEMDAGRYGCFFGDTFGNDFRPDPQHPGPNGGNWRSNVLAFSENKNLDSGIVFTGMVIGQQARAREMIPGHQAGLPTSIPTAAVRADGKDYVHYFNTDPILAGVRFNFSGLFRSVDNGYSWDEVAEVRFASDSRFALAGYCKKNGYVYMIGTPAYRDKPAYLARFREYDIEHQENYEYWNGETGEWIKGDELAASVLIPGTVGELSFLYNETLRKWILVYGDIGHGFVSLRTAENITGPWSNVIELVSPEELPMHYGPYLHPLSASGNTLYFNLSMWEPYNVFLMKAEIIDR